MLAAIAVVFALVAVLLVVLLLISPGKPKPIVDKNGSPLVGSISEKIFIDINGVQQGMFIKSTDASHPVLLYLHGGMPDYFLSERYPTGLEEIFTVIWWEQRGSGISYSEAIPPETMTMEQLIADTIAVTHYLRQRFGQEKIYLMGHSGGSFIGIQAAAKAPELYHAYIGQAQMAYQLRSEVEAYDFMLDKFRADGNTQWVQKLEAAPVIMENGVSASYPAIRDFAMHSLGVGTMHEMDSVITGILIPSFLSRDYTLSEKVNMWRGKSGAGISVIWDRMLTMDLSKEVPALEVPVYFFEGIYDYTCSYNEAKAYFEKLEAPVKGFYTFEQSAHSPMFEEPEKMQIILREDVLRGINDLADIEE